LLRERGNVVLADAYAVAAMGASEPAAAKPMQTEAASNRNLKASNVRGSIEQLYSSADAIGCAEASDPGPEVKTACQRPNAKVN
jgi:hypothetical protein